MKNIDLVEQFLDKRLITSTSTRKNYTSNIKTYFKLINKDINNYFNNGIKPDEYEEDLAKVYMIFEKEDKGQLSRYTFFNAIKQLMVCMDKSLKDLSFWDTLKARTRGAEPDSDEHILNREDIRVILSHGNTLSRALFSMMASSGRRLDEIIALTENDIDTSKSPTTLKITKGYDPSRPNKIKPVKNKQRTLGFISNEATKFYLEWIKERQKYLDNSVKRASYRKKDPNDNRVFPMSKSNVLIIWENMIVKAGFAEKDIKMVTTSGGKIHKRERIKQKYKDSKTNRTLLHRHSLRKFFISYLGDVALADFLAGHSTIMTRAYMKMKPEDLAERYNKLMVNVTFFENTPDLSGMKEELNEMKAQITELRLEKLEKDKELDKLKEEIIKIRDKTT